MMREAEEETAEAACLTPPTLLSSLPPHQSLRRPCLRGRRGSSTIANGSAAEWWRGVGVGVGGGGGGCNEANHYTYKSHTGRRLKWLNACKKNK